MPVDSETSLTRRWSVSHAEALALFGDILRKGLLLRVKVTGRSMRPFLRGGEILVIRKVETSSLRKGDLIFFRNRYNIPVVHRIIRKKIDSAKSVCFETKGDALMSFDEPVSGRDILGKVCRAEGARSLDRESKLWRAMNYLLATLHLIRSKSVLFMSATSEAMLRCRS
jgi:signal peptidase I